MAPLLDGTRVPNVSLQVPGLVVLMRNQADAEEPFGLALPLSCAGVLSTDVAAVVVVVGWSNVWNVKTEPNDVPSEFCAIAQT